MSVDLQALGRAVAREHNVITDQPGQQLLISREDIQNCGENQDALIEFINAQIRRITAALKPDEEIFILGPSGDRGPVSLAATADAIFLNYVVLPKPRAVPAEAK